MRISDWSSDVCSSDLEAAMQRYEHRLARGLAAILNLLAPDVVILGGGLSNLERLYVNVPQIGRASCRERACQYVYISVPAVSFTKKTINLLRIDLPAQPHRTLTNML